MPASLLVLAPSSEALAEEVVRPRLRRPLLLEVEVDVEPAFWRLSIGAARAREAMRVMRMVVERMVAVKTEDRWRMTVSTGRRSGSEEME